MNPVVSVYVTLFVLLLLFAIPATFGFRLIRNERRRVLASLRAPEEDLDPHVRLELKEAFRPPVDREDGFRSYAEHHSAHYASVTAAGCERDGEPVFVLRAQDKNAPAAVRTWAYKAASPELMAEALRIAAAMEAWPHRKEAD